MHRYRNNQESHSRSIHPTEGRRGNSGNSNRHKTKKLNNVPSMEEAGFQLQLKTSYDKPMQPQQYKTRREESPSPFDRRHDDRYHNRHRTSSSSPYTANRHRASSSSPHPQRAMHHDHRQQHQQHYQQQKQQQQQQPQPQREMVSNAAVLNKTSMTEEEFNIQTMREREAEILEINKKMHTVSNIYSDLAGLIDGQQDLIDQIDNQIEMADGYAKAGNENYEEARLVHENPIMADFFGDKVGTGNHRRSGEQGYPPPHSNSQSQQMRGRRKQSRGAHVSKSRRSRSRRSSSRRKDGIDCPEAMPDEMQDVLKAGLKDMKELGNRLITACTAPDTNEVNEYAYRSERAIPKPQNSYAYTREQLSQPQW